MEQDQKDEGLKPEASGEGEAKDTSQPEPVDNSQIAKMFKARVDSSRRMRRQFSSEWKRNVELRMGKIASQFTGGVSVEDDVQTEINPDWALTKTKTANLYSQVPTVQGTHENKQFAAAVPPFMKALNYELSEKRTNVGCAMEEVLNDVVNAAGIGAVLVGYAARTEQVEVPAVDTSMIPPQQLPQLQQAGLIPMTSVERVVSDMFFTRRISPIDLLVPSEFTGSNFDEADWVGHSGKMPWATALHEFKLSAEDEKVLTEQAESNAQDSLQSEPEKGGRMDIKTVHYDELFYWRHRVDPEEKYFKSIWRIVFVKGKDEPVIHEAWKGQRFDPQARTYAGSCKFPIRVLTLTYITDNPIPPSDSAAGRPQVNDMRRSRSQMFSQRERSIPVRWFDVNRIDPLIQDSLMKGSWQAMIPVQGDGSRAIGEIARASYPSEDITFDQAAKSDLMETWQLGPQQTGAGATGRQTKAQSELNQANFATRIGQERARVAYFFLSICEVLAGLMALYSDFPNLTQEEKQQMQQVWDMKHVLHDLVLKIRPDSQIVLDTQQRIDRLVKFLNLTVKSGFVNPLPVITELAELSGVDPSEVVMQPQPKKPEEPNISYRFSGKDDLMNPLVVALLLKHGKLPSPEEVDQAKTLLLSLQQPPKPPASTPPPPQGAGAPGAPGPHPPGPAGAPGPGAKPPTAPPVQDAHDHWTLAGKVAKRGRDMDG